MLDLSSQERSAVAEFARGLEPGRQVGLDPGDDGHRALIEHFLDGMGKHSDRYPALHAALTSGASAAVADGTDDLRIVDVGRDASGRATARGWHAARGGAIHSGAATLVVDSESGEPLAFGSATEVASTLVRSATRTATAAQAGRGVTALSFFHSQRTPDDPPRFGVAMDRREEIVGDGLPINVTAPVLIRSGHTMIVIGTARSYPQYDVDYNYNDPSAWPPPLIVPFTGNCDLGTAISGVQPDKTIQGLSVFTQLYVVAPKAYLAAANPAKLPPRVTCPDPTNQPNTVGWDFTYDSLPATQTNSIVFNTTMLADWPNPVAFLFQFTVPVNSPAGQIQFNVCSYDWPDQPSTQCKQIPDLKFWWHCVAHDTPVTLECGKTVPIQDVDNTMRVRTGLGEGTLGVEATSRGEYEPGGGPLGEAHVLVTKGGRKLTITSHHPVWTPAGPVKAIDLKPGAQVLTEAGPDDLESVEATAYEGRVYNLKLGTADDRAKGLSVGASSFLAGGIVVGDLDALENHWNEARHDPDYMLPRLPDGYQTDYASALEDIATGR